MILNRKIRLTVSSFQCNHIKLLQWPSQSPDLSNMCGFTLKENMLIALANNKINEILEKISMEFVENLIKSDITGHIK